MSRSAFGVGDFGEDIVAEFYDYWPYSDLDHFKHELSRIGLISSNERTLQRYCDGHYAELIDDGDESWEFVQAKTSCIDTGRYGEISFYIDNHQYIDYCRFNKGIINGVESGIFPKKTKYILWVVNTQGVWSCDFTKSKLTFLNSIATGGGFIFHRELTSKEGQILHDLCASLRRDKRRSLKSASRFGKEGCK